MDDREKNVTTIREEDRSFIRALISLSPEKKILFQGILFGMDLQEKSTIVAMQKSDAGYVHTL